MLETCDDEDRAVFNSRDCGAFTVSKTEDHGTLKSDDNGHRVIMDLTLAANVMMTMMAPITSRDNGNRGTFKFCANGNSGAFQSSPV